MSKLNAKRIADMTIEALERTAFVLAELAEDGTEAGLPTAERFARIEYSGPTSGFVYIAASNGFVEELAASLLGVEAEEIEEAQCLDALRELANIVGGSVVLELGGTERLHSLGLPENVTESNIPPFNDSMERCCLDSECERIEVIWAPANKPASAAA